MSCCGICGHTVLYMHYCGECVDELRAALARETERAEKAEERWAFWEESAASLRSLNEDYIRKNIALCAAESERDRLREELAALSHLGTGAGRCRTGRGGHE